MAAVIGALRAVMSLESAAFERGLSSAQKSLADFDKRMKRIGGQIAKAGAALSVVGAGVAAAVKGQLTAADEMAKASAKFGVPVEALSQLRYAADLSGVSFEQLGTALRMMSQRMQMAPKDFEALGIAIRDADGNMRPVEAVLNDVAETLAAMPDGAEKTATAMRLMGESGANMIPLLNGGAEGIKALRQEADSLGLTITSDSAKAAEQFNDSLSKLAGAIRGLVVTMSNDLAPVIAAIAEKVSGLADWFGQLDPQTRKIVASVAALSAVLGPVLVAIGGLVAFLGPMAAGFAAIGAVLAANPIVLILSAIAAAGIAIYTNWAPIEAFFVNLWTNVTQAFTTAWEAIKTGLQDGVTRIRETLVAMWEALKAEIATWPEQMLQAGRDIMQGLVDGLLQKWAELKATVTGIGSGIITSIKDTLGIESPSKVMMEIGGFLMDGLRIGIENGAPAVEGALNGIKSFTDGFADAAKTVFKDVLTGAKSLQESLSNVLGSIADRLLSSGLDMLFGAIFPFANGGAFLNGRPVPFATGGLVQGATPFAMPGGRLGVMGEAGPEAIMPLERVGGKLGVRAAGGGGVTMNVSIDARGATKEAVTGIERQLPQLREFVMSTMRDARRRGAA